MKQNPVIFLTFANDHRGRFLEALRPEQDAINLHLASFQKDHQGIVYNSAASGTGELLEGLNQFTGQLIIFHFSGHSDGQNLQLTAEDGEDILLNGDNLTAILSGEVKANLKLVFLNACLTQGMLKAFQAIDVPAIIATDTSISDHLAKEFAGAFYRSLSSGNTLETAFQQSKSLLAGQDYAGKIHSYHVRDRIGSEGASLKPFDSWGLFIREESVLDWRITELYEAEAHRPTVQSSRNVLVDSPFIAEGDVQIGDQIQTESTLSRQIRLFLFVLVPLLAIGGAYLWYRTQVLQQPFDQRFELVYEHPSPHLAGPEGRLFLTYGNKTEDQSIINLQAQFDDLPSSHKGRELALRYEAEGFETIDTSLIVNGELIRLPVRRDDTYARLIGTVVSLEGREPLEGVLVSLTCCQEQTDAAGRFEITIPAAFQEKQQRIQLFKEGYEAQDTKTPIIKGEIFQAYLKSK